jgi:UDP-N-acetylglucosamine 2-epimerase (non-hydrolysing)
LTTRMVVMVVGTRPEAVKMAPVYRALEECDELEPLLISTGQHRELLDTAFEPLGLVPDHNLDVMTKNQTTADVLARVVKELTSLLEEISPAALLAQGDTTSVLSASMAAYFMHIPVGHIEAGLRTYDHEHPFPEEANRQLVDRISRWCFAPTRGSCENLRSERIEEDKIFETGNTAVDAILHARERSSFQCRADTLLITLHRRESFGEPLVEILSGICDFLEATPGARALWPVHPNPRVREAIERLGRRTEAIECVEPMDYLSFSGAIASCRLVLSDSGGVQEEAPSLGKRVLVAREQTERPEALESGLTRLVGRTREGVRDALVECWNMPAYEGPLPAPNPYGDGRAGVRIVEILRRDLL